MHQIDQKLQYHVTGNLFQINVVLLNFQILKEFSKCILSSTANHHIRMISEGTCDTEDWSNDTENSAF